MSPRRPHEPPLSDRLPGEGELLRLYQHTLDEHPPAALDETVLAAARRSLRPGLRLGRISRRWAVPLSLAAALLVSIGVMTSLRKEIREPALLRRPSPSVSSSREGLSQLHTAEKQSLPIPAEEMARPKNKETESRTTSPRAALPPSALPAQESRPLADQMLSSAEERTLPVLGLRGRSDTLVLQQEEETDTRSGTHALRQTAPVQKRAEPAGKIAAVRGMAGREDTKERTPEAWLTRISELLRAGRQREAEADLEAFQKRYPNYSDYPDSLPKEVLKRLRPPQGMSKGVVQE